MVEVGNLSAQIPHTFILTILHVLWSRWKTVIVDLGNKYSCQHGGSDCSGAVTLFISVLVGQM